MGAGGVGTGIGVGAVVVMMDQGIDCCMAGRASVYVFGGGDQGQTI
jgi:hypothetical protein